MSRRDGQPIWIDGSTQKTTSLKRVSLELSPEARYNEAWLQSLLEMHPELLPVGEIEPDFGQLISVCRELPLKAGSLDNLFVTRSGGLVLVEAKLWRNPQARREVVAQAMDYAAAVFDLSYEEFERAISIARRNSGKSRASLVELMRDEADPTFDEAGFVDAVTRNLRRGRAIVAVVGDGVREDIEAIANLLQSHAGHRFLFTLIELAIFDAPNPGIRIVRPSILARTALIERGVVQVSEGASERTPKIVIDPPYGSPKNIAKSPAISLSQDEFFELLDQREPGLANALRDFLMLAKEHGIDPDMQGGLNLKHVSPVGPPLNLGTITKTGFFESGPATWWGRKEAGDEYNKVLASLIGGQVRDANSGKESSLRTSTAKTPRLADLLPTHSVAWLNAIDEYVNTFIQ